MTLSFQATVKSVVQETPRVRKIMFHLEKQLRFQPGQFVLFVHRSRAEDGHEIVLKRAYSICSPPSTMQDISIALAESANGEVSPIVYGLNVGDVVELEGLYGLFTLKESALHKVFLAGGTGISPIMAMLFALEQRGLLQKATLLYSVKSESDIIFRSELERLQRLGLNLAVTLTENIPVDWTGEKNHITGEMLQRHVEDPASCEFYICGPPTMVESMLRVLHQLGVPRQRVFHERW